MKIIRVFPRKTNASPDDADVRFDVPGMIGDECDRVHVSVTWTWDLQRAEMLAKAWSVIAPAEIGGPGTGMRGEEFTPGMYVKNGYVITSRGCPNKCWFCSVWRRDGNIRELPITEGWNVLDDNLLACSDEHIRAVFKMLGKQKHPIEFTGGLEAARLKPWHCEAMKRLKTRQMFFAYDTPDDYEPLVVAGKMLKDASFVFQSRACRCYVLIGYPSDTIDSAEIRMAQTIKAGFWPMAMLWRDKNGKKADRQWRTFQREYARPAIIASKIKDDEKDNRIGKGTTHER